MMYAEPKIIPLSADGELYAVRDERGNIAGTGTREVCLGLIYIISKLRTTNATSGSNGLSETRRPNVRAAITM